MSPLACSVPSRVPCPTAAGGGLYFNEGHLIRIHSFGLEAGRTAFFPSHHGGSLSRAGFGALTLGTRVPLCFLPSPGPYPPKESTICFQFVCPEGSRFRAFLHSLPSGHPLSPFPYLLSRRSHPGGLRPSIPAPPLLPVLPPARTPASGAPGPSGHAPQPLDSWEGGRRGRAGGEGGGWGACPPRSWAAIGWTAERGRDCCLCLGAPGSSPGILRSSTSGSGDFDAGVATLVQAACLTSGQQWTPKLGGFLTPSRVSPVPLARPGGVARRPLHLLSGRAPAQRPQECLRGSIAE